jgi:hypothetical protein
MATKPHPPNRARATPPPEAPPLPTLRPRRVSLRPKEVRRSARGKAYPGGIVADRMPDAAPFPAQLAPLGSVGALGTVGPPGPRLRTADGINRTVLVASDIVQGPIIPLPINASNGGGALATGVPVHLIFWGAAWNQAATIPSAGTVAGAVQSILRGPWMSGLRQYGVRRCSLGSAIILTNPGPPASYKDSDVMDIVWALIDDGKFPEPDEPGGRNIYVVFMPPGTTYGPGGIRGKHVVASDYDFPADYDNAWVAFVVTNTLDQITSTFCHELAETCTDPESDAWTVTGNQEIGDVCNFVDARVGGILLESYWSVEDNACLIPTAYSVRRALKWSGNTLGGKGLRSVRSPIPSLNQLVVAL